MKNTDLVNSWETVRRAQDDLKAALDLHAGELNRRDYIDDVLGHLAAKRGPFNATNGLQVARLRDGAVKVIIESPEGDRSETWVDAETWASCVTEVSAKPGLGETHQVAWALHMGEAT